MTAANSQTFFAPQTLAKLQGLQLRARRIVEGFVAGLHRSPFRGHSIEFAEHREYAPGDDLRTVDWKVFARTDKYYVKQYEDETNLVCHLVLDISNSMQYRGPRAPMSKLEYAQCLVAALAWLVLNQQDAVALATFDDCLRANVPPSNSAAHWTHIVDVLESVQPVTRTKTGLVLHELAEKLTQRGIVVLVSDLFDDASAISAGLAHLRYQRHDIVLLQVLDPAELEFPFHRMLLFRGLEDGRQVVTDPMPLRRTYLEELRKHMESIQARCREYEIDYRLARTDQPFEIALSTFLSSRMTRRR